MRTGSGSFLYTRSSRFQDTTGANPEELIGAAHAGCFSMALANRLTEAGFKPDRIHTKATVHLDKSGEGFALSKIDLDLEAEVSGIDEPKFETLAEDAKKNCPVSKALSGVKIGLRSRLLAHAGSGDLKEKRVGES
jgi:osmotically inducible protein OsmC